MVEIPKEIIQSEEMAKATKENNEPSFSQKFFSGWVLLKESFTILLKFPKLLLPIVVCWTYMAFVVLYLEYYFVAPDSPFVTLTILFLFILSLSYMLCITNLILLELIQQKEFEGKLSLSKAYYETITYDSLTVIPLAVCFALIWFVIVLLRSATSRSRGSKRHELSPKEAALTLGGINSNPFSWFGLGLTMLEKLVRMVLFLSLPAIAWENKGPIASLKESVSIIKMHPSQFLSTYSITFVASLIMCIPLVPIYIVNNLDISLPTVVWIGVILYECIAWSLGIYLEQMSVGLLYLWHLKWQRNGSVGSLSSIAKPNLLDGTLELSILHLPPEDEAAPST